VEVIPVGKDKFTLEKYKMFRSLIELGVIECQWKDDGAINNTPSLLFIMKDRQTNIAITQMTLETLQGIMSKCGYRIVKKKGK
jgi:hypothetical protein